LFETFGRPTHQELDLTALLAAQTPVAAAMGMQPAWPVAVPVRACKGHVTCKSRRQSLNNQTSDQLSGIIRNHDGL